MSLDILPNAKCLFTKRFQAFYTSHPQHNSSSCSQGLLGIDLLLICIYCAVWLCEQDKEDMVTLSLVSFSIFLAVFMAFESKINMYINQIDNVGDVFRATEDAA